MPKKPVTGQKQVIVFSDFSGGQNDAIHAALLNDNECAVLESASLDEKGTLMPDKGREERYGSPIHASKPTNGLGAYYKSDGTSRLLIGVDNALYSDLPRLVFQYNTKQEWEQAGTIMTNIDSETTAGDITIKAITYEEQLNTAALWQTGSLEGVAGV